MIHTWSKRNGREKGFLSVSDMIWVIPDLPSILFIPNAAIARKRTMWVQCTPNCCVNCGCPRSFGTVIVAGNWVPSHVMFKSRFVRACTAIGPEPYLSVFIAPAAVCSFGFLRLFAISIREPNISRHFYSISILPTLIPWPKPIAPSSHSSLPATFSAHARRTHNHASCLHQYYSCQK